MRRAGATRREVLPDPKHGSRLVAKFVNMMMYGGKKSTAEQIMYDAMASMEDRAKQEAIKLFKAAVDNCKPAVEVKSRRVGGSTYQVPVEVRPDRRTALSMRWLIGAAPASSRKEHVGEVGGRAAGCGEQSRHRREEARRHPQDGGGQQGVRALPLVATEIPRGGRTPGPPLLFLSSSHGRRERNHCGTAVPARKDPEHRHHGPHRCRQDDHDGADPLLHRPIVQDRRGARGHGRHGLDGPGARARHHHHLGGDHELLERLPDQYHRHAGPRGLHHGGRAFAAGARRRHRHPRCGVRRRAADRDGMAAGRQVPGAAARVRQQDGPGRGRLLPVPGDAQGASGRSSGARSRFPSDARSTSAASSI